VPALKALKAAAHTHARALSYTRAFVRSFAHKRVTKANGQKVICIEREEKKKKKKKKKRKEKKR